MKWIDDNYDAIMSAIQRYNLQVECHDMPGCEPEEDEMAPVSLEPNENTPAELSLTRDGFSAEFIDFPQDWDFNYDDCCSGYFL